MSARIVIGTGTGRSGTASLAVLLNNQHRSRVTHEDTTRGFVSWNPEPAESYEDSAAVRLAGWRERLERQALELTGDCWSAHMPYVPYYIRQEPSVRIVIVERDRDAVVESFSHKVPELFNHWQLHGGKTEYSVTMPRFPGHLSRGEAIGHYCDMVRFMTRKYVDTWPDNVRLVALEALFGVDPSERLALLDWLEVESPRPFDAEFLHVNARGTFDDEEKSRAYYERLADSDADSDVTDSGISS